MSPQKPRQDRPLVEQHEDWTAHLRRQVVSRRTVVRGAVGAAAGSLLPGSGRWADAAVAATLAGTGTIAGGFVVNGQHLSFGEDPATEMRVGGQLLNVSQYNAVPPRSVRVFLLARGARRGLASARRHHLLDRRHRREAPLRLDRHPRNRPELRRRPRQRHHRGGRRQIPDRPVRHPTRLQPGLRDGGLVAGSVQGLRLHRPRVTPAPLGQKTTMVLRFINQQGRELDRVVFNRMAGVG
jgi:hypothetical protein